MPIHLGELARADAGLHLEFCTGNIDSRAVRDSDLFSELLRTCTFFPARRPVSSSHFKIPSILPWAWHHCGERRKTAAISMGVADGIARNRTSKSSIGPGAPAAAP